MAHLWSIDFEDHTGAHVGTLAPGNLRFIRNRNEPHTVSCATSLHDPALSPDLIGPYRTDFKLKRDTKVIMRGMVTDYTINVEDETVSFGGHSWLHYLQRRYVPFIGNEVFPGVVVGGLPSYFAVEQPLEAIVTGILTTARDIDAYSLDFTISCDATGHTGSYRVDYGDTSFVFDHISSLSNRMREQGGFDFDITNSKVFRLYYPDRSTEQTIVYSFDNIVFVPNHPFRSFEFTNKGPLGTHVVAQVNAGGSTFFSKKGFPANHEVFRRLDYPVSVGDYAKDTFQLSGLASSRLSVSANPVHEIPISIDVNLIEDTLGIDFYDSFWPGYQVWVDYDADYHHVNSLQNIITMDVNVTNEGDEVCAFGLDQWYDVSLYAGIDED